MSELQTAAKHHHDQKDNGFHGKPAVYDCVPPATRVRGIYAIIPRTIFVDPDLLHIGDGPDPSRAISLANCYPACYPCPHRDASCDGRSPKPELMRSGHQEQVSI